MSLVKKWSSLPILHFAIFHHYCHETEHSGFILQPNCPKGTSFLHHHNDFIISVHRHSQQLWEANQASAPHPLGHLPPSKWGWDDEEKNQDGIPHHPANIQTLAGWEELVTPRQPDTGPGSSDLIQIRFWTPRTFIITLCQTVCQSNSA